MRSLAVRVIGDFGVDGVEPQAFGSKKARQALGLLALGAGQAVPVSVLTDALWGDASPARPGEQLAVLMSRLRAVLGKDRVEHRDGGYLLHCDWLDATELAVLTDEVARRQRAGNAMGAVAAARVALSLVRDESRQQLPGEWAGLRQAELARLTLRARMVAASALLEAGDWMAAADAASAVLAREPYDEAALRLLLRARVTGGQVAAALAAYASARARLADDLGTDPSPETVALHTEILRGGPAGQAPRAAARVDLVGRDDELACLDAVAARSRSGPTEVVVVDGEAGIGKTTLLRAWAAQRAAAGDTVLAASCGLLGQSMPLDALLGALAGLLRRLGPDASAELLAGDESLLAPLMSLPPGPGSAPAPGTAPMTSTAPSPGAAPVASTAPMLVDSMLGPTVVYAALARVLGRLATRAPVVLVVDDAHLASPALADWLRFAQRENVPLTTVAAVRLGEETPLPATTVVHLGVLGRDAAAALVGPARLDELYERSKGHPLFLTELAQLAAHAELPRSLVESVSGRCDDLGSAGALLRTAAVIGPDLDVDLLAAVLGRPVVDVLDDAERAAASLVLTEEDGTFRFRHELVREALARATTAGRAALLHRQAGRVLGRRPAADPLAVAHHARLGGDLVLASRALRDAAARASGRFDHAAAEALLDDALQLHAEPAGWLARARVRTLRRRYAEALDDVARAAPAGAAALETGAWACYFDRDFARAAQFAEDGALAAADAATRARCLAVGGRTRHAAGDLAQAEALLGEALSLAHGADRVTTAAWLGVLRAHQSRVDEALSLLRPAARAQAGVEHTSATLHALLFTGHAHALAGRPAEALAAFGRYTSEVDRRHVPRFAGRGVNFAGWVLRNLGARTEALERHHEALAAADRDGTVEVTIAARQDLAEHCLETGDPDGAVKHLAVAAELLRGDLVFGWRLRLKQRLVTARLALVAGEPERALAAAHALASAAGSLGVSRYGVLARLLTHRASQALGLPLDLAAVTADLDEMDQRGAIECWWWTGDLAAGLAHDGLLDRAATRAARLAAQAGAYSDTLRREADRRLACWRGTRPGQVGGG